MRGGGPGGAGGRRPEGMYARDRDHTTSVLDREMTRNTRRLRRRRQLEAILERGGLRAILELIEEMIPHRIADEGEVEDRLAAYAALDPAKLRAVGGDQLPSLPIRAIMGRSR